MIAMMKWLSAIFLAVGLCAVNIGTANAQQPPADTQIKRTPLHRVDVPGANYEVVYLLAELAANARAGRHSHPGTVFAYVLQGEVKLVVDGQPERMVKPGETFQVAPGTIHDEVASSQPVKILAVFTVEKGKPLATLAP